LPKISIISNGPGDLPWPDKATLRGHKSSPLPCFSVSGERVASSNF